MAHGHAAPGARRAADRRRLLALFAIWVARRPHTPRGTYGYHRAEVLAAALSGLVILLVAGLITREAILRLGSQPEVDALGLLLVASAGLVANLVQAWLLRAGHTMPARAARLHVLADLGGSLAAITAGAGVHLTGWRALDPALSLAIVCPSCSSCCSCSARR
ncbi:MAG: cation transporter [Chloroflexi bacterium]|nr:cation transporter [Chloroflexota bacterium]